MLLRNKAGAIMGDSLLAEGAAIPFVPFTEDELKSALKRRDVLVYVPQTSLNEVVEWFKGHFSGNLYQYRDAGYMRSKHDAAWWIVGIGPYVRDDVAVSPRRATALVLVYACILSEKYAQRTLFTGVATTDSYYNTGAPATFRQDQSQVIAVWSHDKKISLDAVFESSLPKNKFTAYSLRGI